MRGWEFAIHDIGLAIFTAVSPAATLAFVVLAGLLVFGTFSEEDRARLEGWLIVPLALVMVGLVASTTHLGTPSNALYVLNRAGQSPLSTEVVSAVVFLGLGCTYWYSTIYIKGTRLFLFKRVWLVVAAAAGLIFLWGATQAYVYSTVVTWTETPAWTNLVLTAVGAFAPIVVLMLAVTGQCARTGLLRCACCVGAVGALASGIVMLVVHDQICAMYNAYGCAQELVPHFVLVSVLYMVATVAANAMSLAVALACGRRHRGESARGTERTQIAMLAFCVVLVLVAAFAIRFEFYCMHMTAGMV